MPRNDEGEFELVLGNRQLLGVFFIVVILLGVFFTMGHIVGRNSAPAMPDSTLAKKAGPEPSAPAASGPSPAGPAVPGEPPALQTQAPRQTQAPSPPLQPGQVHIVQPGAGTTPAAPPKPTKVTDEIGRVEIEKPQKIVRQDPKQFLMAEIVPGQTYLQVAAVKRPEAELIASVLRRKGFLQAVVAPGPNETIYRVVVGPITNADALSKTKSDLEAAGFKSIVKKY